MNYISSAQVAIFINRSSVPLGGELKLSWATSGNLRGFSDMTISLQGYEESKCPREGEVYMDKEVFYEKVLFNSSNLSDIAKSDTVVNIPSNSVPSFIGENNKIVWCVLVKATIKCWTNLDEAYDLVVTPINTLAVK